MRKVQREKKTTEKERRRIELSHSKICREDERIQVTPALAVPLDDRVSVHGPDNSLENKKLSAGQLSRKKRRDDRIALQAQLPSTDEHGIGYTKIQIRRMRRRVQRGLNPIETTQETAQRIKQEAELQRQEQAEFAGLNDDDVSTLNPMEEVQEKRRSTPNEDSSTPSICHRDNGNEENVTNLDTYPAVENNHLSSSSSSTDTRRKRRRKPIPPDYVCQACQNTQSPPLHWIYDCPSKVTVRGTNQVAKKWKGVHNPENKVFVGGLPFDMKPKDLLRLFTDCGAVVKSKLLTFDDSNRCKGQAFVTFDTSEGARQALLLNGTTMKAKETSKELKLKVTKAVNRTVTSKSR